MGAIVHVDWHEEAKEFRGRATGLVSLPAWRTLNISQSSRWESSSGISGGKNIVRCRTSAGRPSAGRTSSGRTSAERSSPGRTSTRRILSEAGLRGAYLYGANLNDADLSGAKLSDADLRRTDLIRSNLSGADLRNADVSGTNLFGTNLSGAKLSGADVSGAALVYTIFANTDLSGTKGLELCRHEGPSSIGIDTFYRSKGNIPESFLRGCGVPEVFITYARSLVGQPFEFYSCFISYSSQDQAFAERLHADMRAKDLRCWYAPEDLKIGDRFQERIEESLRVFDKVMIVLSEASVESRWVEREVNAAREREDREKRTILFPIRIDDAVMNAPQPWAADIRRMRHIGDFREWEANSAYLKAFNRLLRDLKATERAAEQPG